MPYGAKGKKMKNSVSLAICVGLILTMTTVAGASIDSFLADSNQFGYQGTVRNLTKGTAAETFPTPRDGTVFFATNVPGIAETYNAIQSNWYQHPGSNQNPGFFQLNDGGTVTAAAGAWTQSGSLWDFTLTVTGQNATYENSYSRLWQPDAGHAWGGTFTDYTYTLTATGMPTTVTDGWRYNMNDPTDITGSFDATFISTSDLAKDPITNGDAYSVHLDFAKDYWDSTDWSDVYAGVDYGNYSTFGAPVPEPTSLLIWALGILGVAVYVRRK